MNNSLSLYQKKLIEDNLPFVYYWFNLHHIYNEDDKQDYLYAICKYIHLFDEEKGSITTFLGAILSSKKLSVLKHDKTIKATAEKLSVNLDDVVFELDGDPITWADMIGNSDRRLEVLENKDFYNDFLYCLKKDKNITEHQLNIFIAYINTGNYKAVARMYKCSAQNIHQIVNSVRDKVKKWKFFYV